jgi:hypothetical protein
MPVIDAIPMRRPPKFDAFVESQKFTKNVMPAKAGIQKYEMVRKELDPGFRRGDDVLRGRKVCLDKIGYRR